MKPEPYKMSLTISGDKEEDGKPFYNKIVNYIEQLSKDSSKESKPKPTTIYRHFRKWDYIHNQIASNGGMTALIKLDYDEKRIYVYPAFCSDKENFCKIVGKRYADIAMLNEQGFSVPLFKSSSIAFCLRHAVASESVVYSSKKSRERIERRLVAHFNEDQ